MCELESEESLPSLILLHVVFSREDPPAPTTPTPHFTLNLPFEDLRGGLLVMPLGYALADTDLDYCLVRNTAAGALKRVHIVSGARLDAGTLAVRGRWGSRGRG